MVIILSYVLTLTLMICIHRLGSWLLRTKKFVWFDMLFAGMISLAIVALFIVFKPLVTKSELREENYGDSMYWQGVRFSLISMIPVLVLRSWKFKIGIYIALYIVMFVVLNDFRNSGSYFTIFVVSMIGCYMASIWKVVDNQ